MWTLKHGTNEPVYKTETESQTQRTDFWLPRGRRWGGEVNMLNTVYRTNKNKALLHCAGNSIQYPVINHNRKEYFLNV